MWLVFLRDLFIREGRKVRKLIILSVLNAYGSSLHKAVHPFSEGAAYGIRLEGFKGASS